MGRDSHNTAEVSRPRARGREAMKTIDGHNGVRSLLLIERFLHIRVQVRRRSPSPKDARQRLPKPMGTLFGLRAMSFLVQWRQHRLSISIARWCLSES
jgi:hypothetical protein